MYGIHRFDESLTILTLATPNGPALPFGFPHNVFVFHGSTITLLDTGLGVSREPLLAALREIGVAPSKVTRILLTSALPEAIGNVTCFPNALVWAPPAIAKALKTARNTAIEVAAELISVARELADSGLNPAWKSVNIQAFGDRYIGDIPAALTAATVAEGQLLRAGDCLLEVVAAPGTEPSATVYLEQSRRWLFGGESIVLATEPRIRQASLYNETLLRISQFPARVVFPSHGGPERNHFAIFRSLNLFAANLLNNMPFALQGQSNVAQILHNDLGYYPSDLIRFSSSLLRYQAVIEELVRSQLAGKTGDGALAMYSMDRPSRG